MALPGLGQAQEWPGKYLSISEDGLVVVYLRESDGQLEGGLLLGYGLLFPFEGQAEGAVFRGELSGAEPRTLVEGQLEGDMLTVTLMQDGKRQEFALERQTGAERFGEATSDESASPLLQMLALVPDVLDTRQGTPGVAFVDLRALEAAAGVESPGTAAAYEEMSEEARDAWSAALQRVRVGPAELLAYRNAQMEGMPGLVGFEWFDIERLLAYGAPPASVTVLAAEVDSGRLAERLAARGFERVERHGVTIWHHQRDGALDLRSRDPADPFGANMGRAQRIAVLPGHLANSAYWRATEAVTAAHAGHAPALADSPEYRALAEAVSDSSTGALLQAVFLHPMEVGVMPGDPIRPMEPGREQAGERSPGTNPEEADGDELPWYGLAVLADRQEGGERVSVVALLYQDAATARAAAEVLARRLASFAAAVAAGTALGIDEPRVHVSESGLAAAVASVRVAPSAEGEIPRGGFAAWLDALYRRELAILQITGAH